jgi:AraC-like DNA-binding protein
MSARHDANRRLLRARDEMDRSYADALDIAALARSVHLSRAHLIRSFRDPFGNSLRITQPAELPAEPV